MSEPVANPSVASAAYVLVAHPQLRQSRVNQRLLIAAQDSSKSFCDLYASYPDYLIDVPAEQAKLAAAQLLVVVHPLHWYGMPALLKLWLDEVFTYGWAYGGGPAGALQGKDLWLVTSTGGTEASYHPSGYNRYFFDAFLPPYEQTAALCGMRFLPPLVLHGAHHASAAELDDHVQVFAERLQSYPDWPELHDLQDCPTCAVPINDRPLPSSSGAV